ncbi:MAG: DUF4130 domain-containing protein [Nanoarchaeota archaeon]
MHKEFNLANRHKNFDKKVYDIVRKQDVVFVENLATPEARRVYNWNRQVAGCYQRSRAFCRMKISKHSIVYCSIDPEHFVEDLVARWFLSRFPMFTIMVESKRGTFVISKTTDLVIYDKKIDELLPEFEKIMPENSILSDLTEFDEDSVWEGYYDSQFIKERKNKKYFLKNIPKKFHNWGSLKVEKEKFRKDIRLDEF